MWMPAIRVNFDSCEMTLEKPTHAEKKISERGIDSYKLCDKIQNMKGDPRMIQRVIFNPPATIVFWRDGSKTVVKCGENDIFDPEKGLAMAISKRAFGDNRDYYEVFAKWIGKYEYQQKKKERNDYDTEASGSSCETGA